MLLETGVPLAITRHGETVGYFIPSRERASAEDIAELHAAGAELDRMLEEAGISEDEWVAEFRHLRASQTE